MPLFDQDVIGDPAWFFASLVDQLPVNVVCKDAQGRFIYVNQAFAALMDRPAEEFIGKTDMDISSRELAHKYRADDYSVMNSGAVFREIERIKTGSNGSKYFEVRKTPLFARDGSVVGIEAVFWDVTAQKRAEADAQHERFLLESLMNNIPDSIYFKDEESRFIRVSRGLSVKFGLNDPAEVYGKTDAHVFSSKHAKAARADELRIMKTRLPVLGKVERETWQDGPDTWCSSTKMPLLDKKGTVVGTFGVSRDVTELILTEEALRKAKKSADSANRAKGDFLANMSHEIRTPMNAVLGITELLLDSDLSDQQREYLNMVLSSGESLLALINDILDFSKIEAGKLALHKTAFDLRSAIRETANVLNVRATEKQLQLNFIVENDVPNFLVGDVGRLRQVLINLVGNAIKFTAEGSVDIKVACQSTGETKAVLVFKVTDTGIGIEKSKIDLVFHEFEQADSSTTRDFEGSGLGLAISSRIVELMGGKMALESEIGNGSTFQFTGEFGLTSAASIQAAELRPADSELTADNRQETATPSSSAAPQTDERKLVSETDRTGTSFGDETVREGHGSSTGRRSKPSEGFQSLGDRPLNVLVVEDNIVNQKLAIGVLARGNHQVTVANNGLEAVKIFPQQTFDLILMDVQMPEMDGFEATKRIRQMERGSGSGASKHTPIIAMTARAMESDRQACLDAGMDFYLSKPIRLNQLAAHLNNLSGRNITKSSASPNQDDSSNQTLSESLDSHSAEQLRVDDGPEAHGPKVQVDWDVAKANVNGDSKLLRALVDVLRADAPRILEEIESSIELADGAALKLHAHTLRGSVRFLGDVELAKPAEGLEIAGSQNVIQDSTRQIFQELRTHWIALDTELDVKFSTGDADS